MRDPDATLSFGVASVIRAMKAPVSTGNFLLSTLARSWVGSGLLVPYEMLDEHRLRAPRLPFVTQPDEWCDAQLWDAAALTLRLQAESVANGYELKDASAWNVLFDGCRPQFCDHSSLQALSDLKWRAAGQFGRHFLLPLLLSRKSGLRAHQSFALWRDGAPPATAARLLGKSRFLTRYWPLMAEPREHPTQSPTARRDEAAAADANRLRSFRAGLQASLEWMLTGVRVAQSRHNSPWSGYVDLRLHYSDDGVARKRSQVADWLAKTRPPWVADLGCNSGEFSDLALEAGSSVVAVDGDHDSVQALYRRHAESRRLYPVVAQLDDLSAGRGWAGSEHRGLALRMEKAFDLTMMLALIHHLAVGAAIPLAEVARFAAKTTRRWLIVEFIGSEDPQLQLLCMQRHRDIRDFTPQLQRQAFLDAGFEVDEETDLAPTHRSLAMLRLAG